MIGVSVFSVMFTGAMSPVSIVLGRVFLVGFLDVVLLSFQDIVYTTFFQLWWQLKSRDSCNLKPWLGLTKGMFFVRYLRSNKSFLVSFEFHVFYM